MGEAGLHTESTRSKLGTWLAAIYLMLSSVLLALALILSEAGVPLLYLVLLTLPWSFYVLLFQATGNLLLVSLAACVLLNAASLYFIGVLLAGIKRWAREEDRKYAERFL